MADLSKCKICGFELGHDEGWGSQVCDSCQFDLEFEDHYEEYDDDDDDDDGFDFEAAWASDIEAANARDSRPIGVEKRQESADV